MHTLVRRSAMDRAGAEDDTAPGLAEGEMILDAMLGVAEVAARQLPWTIPLPKLRPLPRPQPLPGALVARLTASPEAWFAAKRTNILTGLSKVARWGWEAEAVSLLGRLHGCLRGRG